MFTRRESFSQYIRLYPVVSFLLALNIIIYLITMLPFIGIKVHFGGVGINYLYRFRRMVAIYYANVSSWRNYAYSI